MQQFHLFFFAVHNLWKRIGACSAQSLEKDWCSLWKRALVSCWLYSWGLEETNKYTMANHIENNIIFSSFHVVFPFYPVPCACENTRIKADKHCLQIDKKIKINITN